MELSSEGKGVPLTPWNTANALSDPGDKGSLQQCSCACSAEDREVLALPTTYMPNHDKEAGGKAEEAGTQAAFELG